jgi:hypothetical protein
MAMRDPTIKEAHLKTLVTVSLTHSHLRFIVPDIELSKRDRILDVKVG